MWIVDYVMHCSDDGSIVSEVLALERMKPIAEALFLRPVWDDDEPDLVRARIAQIFIHAGFRYLTGMQKEYVSGLYERAVNDGIEACRYLVEFFMPSEERRAIHRFAPPKP